MCVPRICAIPNLWQQNKDENIFYRLYHNTFCQTIAGPLLSKLSASHGIVILSPSLRKYNTFGTTINFGGCWTITSIGVDGPSVPKSLNGVHVYLPPCSFSTYICTFNVYNVVDKTIKMVYVYKYLSHIVIFKSYKLGTLLII